MHPELSVITTLLSVIGMLVGPSGLQPPVTREAIARTSVVATGPRSVAGPNPGAVGPRESGIAPRAAAATSPASRWSWPIPPPHPVVAGFDPPAQRWLAGHRGVDLGAPVGTPVFAPADGTVAFAGMVAGRGVLSIDHIGGVRSTYEPVTPLVAAGQQVRRGEVVATVASTGGHCSPASCLHWGARRGDTYLNPLAFVGRVPIILLPLD